MTKNKINNIGWIKYFLGVFSAIVYSELKQVEGYFWVIPFVVLIICLLPSKP